MSISVFVAELRRLIDWNFGYNSLSFVNLLPTIALIPLIVVAFRRGAPPMGESMKRLVWLWSLGFGYAIAVGYFQGAAIPGFYDFVLFFMPMIAGIWLVRQRDTPERLFLLLANTSLWLGAVAGAYGIVQYVAPPAWDVNWVNNVQLISIGSPVPFGLRIFSTLNSPEVFADFLTLVILVNLPYLRLRSWPRVGALALCVAALALTLVRSSWLALLLGLIVYLLFSPTRSKIVTPIVAAMALLSVIALNTSTLFGTTQVGENLAARFSTFGDLQHDSSAVARQSETSAALHESLSEPLGQGLGSIGTSTKLAASGTATVLDNGYLSRFFEMGVPGFAFYLFTIAAAIGMTLRRWTVAIRQNDERDAAFAAVSLAVQIALAGLDVSSDHHSAFMGVYFWCIVALTLNPLRYRPRIREPYFVARARSRRASGQFSSAS